MGEADDLILPFIHLLGHRLCLQDCLLFPDASFCRKDKDGCALGRNQDCTEKQNVVHMASVSFAAEVESKSEWCKTGGGKSRIYG